MNPLDIHDIQGIFSKYMDIKSIANLKVTCKKYNKDYKKLLVYKGLHYNGITNITLNLIKHLPEFIEIDLTRNFCVIKLDIFKIICKRIIFNNNYKCQRMSSVTHLLFMYRDLLNVNEWEIFILTFLNNNLNIIKETDRISTWNSIFSLRYKNTCNDYIEYDKTKDKFIRPSNE